MIININQNTPEAEKIAHVVEVLKNGGIIVYPTDTIYGLGCDVFNKEAIKKIYQLKKHESKKPLSIICADLKHVAQYAIISDHAFHIMKKVLPGPFTFILKAKNKLPSTFLAKNKTVGIRIPDNQICLQIVKTLGHPIITTSLNISGEEIMTSPLQMSKELANKIDLIIDIGLLAQEPSTIIDLSAGKTEVLRQGRGDASKIL
ncbi:MAG: L-threonylcarbamoyladenylate synthase [Candidatus Parcubacteria bacterium]|nr:L-threonylcarbamoyladenylate synthase [Candidatus Parcubacteria bacterium]